MCTLGNLNGIMLFLLFILIISAECYARRSTACSLEFSLVGSKCYHFSKEIKSWGDAYYQCLSKNSSLAVLENSKVERQMRSYIKHHSQSLGKHNRWIGGKFDWRNNEWVWAETAQPILYKAFSVIPPNDKRLLQWTCIVLDSNRMNKWSFKSCLQQNHYICQKKPRHPIQPRRSFNIKICKRAASQLSNSQKSKCLKMVGGYGGLAFPNFPAPMIQTPKPTTKNVKEYICPPHMFIIKNRCYYFGHEKLNWNDAYWACRDNKTYLAVIQNRVQDKLLKEILDSGLVGRHERWLGGLYDWKQKRWLWANSGKPLKYQGFPFRNYTGPQFEWRSTTIDPNIGNMWSSRLRTDLKHYICQKRAKSIAKLGDFNTDYSNESMSNESKQEASSREDLQKINNINTNEIGNVKIT